MNDLTAHYLVMVGEVCAKAHSATLSVVLTLQDGTTRIGVPQPREAGPSDPAAVDDTGFADQLKINDETIRLDDVANVSIGRP